MIMGKTLSEHQLQRQRKYTNSKIQQQETGEGNYRLSTPWNTTQQ
jgi:hypothetical protein